MATYRYRDTVVTAPDNVVLPADYEKVEKPKKKAAPKKKAEKED